MTNYKLTEQDRAFICEILGYLNFSSGSVDVKLLKAWNELFLSFEAKGAVDIWRDVLDALRSELAQLSDSNPAFQNSKRCYALLDVMEKALEEYRLFHVDTLFNIKNSLIYNSFFMAKLCSVVAKIDDENGGDVPVNSVLEHLNDYIGYRPIPVLEGEEKHEPDQHEWIAPVPLYYDGVGVAQGIYSEVVEHCLKILRDTDESLLFSASFDPDKLRELAIDPRPYDFDHPVHLRVNYAFGTWDDRAVDDDGYFRRFIVPRSNLDSIMKRVWDENDPRMRKEYAYEAGAVLAGTILMASGICGGRVQAYDSTVSLHDLANKVSEFRDKFYEVLITKVPDSMKARLTDEAARLFQPFAGARQALNRELARKRADQLQRFSLARTYARMGYFKAARQQADVIETPSARLLSRIDCLITEAHLKTDVGKLQEAAELLPKIEETLRRGLACGAFPDPWFILGFDAQFSLYPSPDSGVHDHRIDGLIDLLNDIFDLYSRIQKEAAATGKAELRVDLSEQMSALAGWWDQFGSTEVTSVEGFSGQEVWESAAKVSTALAAWSKAGGAVGDVKFWSRHVERFKSPKAFVLLGEALLEKNDLISAASLLIYWLDQSMTIPLTEADYSFTTLAEYWMREVWADQSQPNQSNASRRAFAAVDNNWTAEEYLKRWKLAKSFLDRIEANADEYWEAPKIELEKENFDRELVFKTDNPLLADLGRRIILDTRRPVPSDGARQRILVKSSFRDATRVFNDANVPNPEEFEKFYDDNASVFPKYLDFESFLEIFAALSCLSEEKKKIFIRYLAQRKRGSEGGDDADENRDEPPSLYEWSETLRRLGAPDSSAVNETIRRMFTSRSIAPNASFQVANPDADVFDDDPFADDQDSERSIDGYETDDGDEEETITGGDAIFRAAYDHMSYRDSADDGNEGETAGGGAAGYGEQYDDENQLEFVKETDRIAERLAFIDTIALLWKSTAEKSPLLNYYTQEAMTDETLKAARMAVESWLDQALIFEKKLFKLLDQTVRFRIPKPIGSIDSLVEYDQLRGAKEILLDRVEWTIVDVQDAIVSLRAALRIEEAESYEKPWKRTTLQVMSAIFRRDSARVRALWDSLLQSFKSETLLYIPTGRGGDARAITEARGLQRIIVRLMEYAPRLGLFSETLLLISRVKQMEQNRLSAPGSITEYDRFVEAALRSMTEALAETSESWGDDDPDGDVKDKALVSALNRLVDVILKPWLAHSGSIRVSSVESLNSERDWSFIKSFVMTYGEDLFTQQFLNFRNLRAILHQGASAYLASLIEIKRNEEELENGEKLIDDIEAGKIDLKTASSALELILECVAEQYSEYVDYNSSTIQSDHGAKLYMFLDFLRLLAKYERVSWNFKPLYWVHDALIRAGRIRAAELWSREIQTQSSTRAEKNLEDFNRLQNRYGMWLKSVYERLSERFVRPLEIAQICGMVFDVISEVRAKGEDNDVFKKFDQMVERLAKLHNGAGWELPDWLNELQDEVVLARVDAKEERRQREPKEQFFDALPFPTTLIGYDEFVMQIQKAAKQMRD
ncbi:MAG: hypothetical protein IJU03_04580 [Thermoguttaceae bacterium]|nr:hypothetical protein [Thermoguttaceae bacterium]